MAYYSCFWLTGAVLRERWPDETPTLTPDDPLPTAAELSHWAALPFAERQAQELAVLGEVWTMEPDRLDRREARRSARAAQRHDEQRSQDGIH